MNSIEFMHCKKCGFPAPDDFDGVSRMQDHMSDTHNIEGWADAIEFIDWDDNPPDVKLLCW